MNPGYSTTLRVIARNMVALARDHENDWLKQADPRAIQGGDHDREAAEFIKLACRLTDLAKLIAEAEDDL